MLVAARRQRRALHRFPLRGEGTLASAESRPVEVGRDLIGSLGRSSAVVGSPSRHRTSRTTPTRGYTPAGVDLVADGSQVGDVAAGPGRGPARVKEPAEADAMRRAARLSDEVFEQLAQERFTGAPSVTSPVDRVAPSTTPAREGLSFSSIVAAGTNGASPHAVPGERVIEPGTLVTIDMGCVVEGYCSDCTRTFATGELPTQLAEAYELCLQAQLDGLAGSARARTDAMSTRPSRVAIEAAGLGELYGHGLGHGVGLDVHEAPVLRPESADTLVAGKRRQRGAWRLPARASAACGSRISFL